MSHLNLKNKRASKTAIGIAMCAFWIALVSGVGFSAWVFGGAKSGQVGLSANAGAVAEVKQAFIVPDSLQAFDYGPSGFVENHVFGSTCHVDASFHLNIAEASSYVSSGSVTISGSITSSDTTVFSALQGTKVKSAYTSSTFSASDYDSSASYVSCTSGNFVLSYSVDTAKEVLYFGIRFGFSFSSASVSSSLTAVPSFVVSVGATL